MKRGVISEFGDDERVHRGREEFAQYFLKKKGFDAFQCSKSETASKLERSGYGNVLTEIAELASVEHVKGLFGVGCPDLIACNDSGFMFVEVKSFEDGLRLSQVKWIAEHSCLPVKILYVE